MIRFLYMFTYLIAMIAGTIFLVNWGWSNEENWTLYIALGLPIWIYLFVSYIKRLNTVKCKKEHFILRNPFLRNRIIRYEAIKWWKEIYINNMTCYNLIIGLGDKNIIITDMIAKRNYEDLKHLLRVKLTDQQKY